MMMDVIRRFRQLHHQMSTKLCLLSYSETAILQITRKSGNYISVSEIARASSSSLPSISRTLRQLRKKGYIDSCTDENDRRNTYVALTPAGQDILAKDMEQRKRFHAAVVQRMGEDEWNTMCRLVLTMHDCMQQELENWPDNQPVGKE